MAEAAAHLVERVFPEEPVRQWVLSFPWRIRYLLAIDPRLCRAVRRIFLRAVFGFLGMVVSPAEEEAPGPGPDVRLPRRRDGDAGDSGGRCAGGARTRPGPVPRARRGAR